eukprot:gnl/TRDRNA2_/TRDRNA2_185156_c0_seq1.p1 gnl/TRDRNA2_/TRDRNA2_185156_c0~~gnl/TRDRNA2_/TRDRNA2_185156_c0_seq1.p1  ORF type:complete len:592 (-),score=95.76 gnl/TRDRNA2_/TRDRNA2_185156_c0_seq1:25-1554(-)
MSVKERASDTKGLNQLRTEVGKMSKDASQPAAAPSADVGELEHLRDDLARLAEAVAATPASQGGSPEDKDRLLSQLLSELSQSSDTQTKSNSVDASADQSSPSSSAGGADRQEVVASITADEYKTALQSWYLRSWHQGDTYKRLKGMTKSILGTWFATSPSAEKYCSGPLQGPGLGGIIYLVKAGKGNFWRTVRMQETWVRHVGPEDRVLFLADEDVEWNNDHKKLESVLRVPVHSMWPDCKHPNPAYKEGCSPYHLLPLKIGYGLRAAAEMAEQQGLKPSWYMILDDDTFIVPKHMRRALARHDPTKALVLGNIGPSRCPGVCGGAGWAMSVAAIDSFREHYDEYMNECVKAVPYNIVFDDGLIPNFLLGRKSYDANTVPASMKATLHELVEVNPFAPRAFEKSPEQWFGSIKWNELIYQFEDRQGGFALCPATFHAKDPSRSEEISRQVITNLYDQFIRDDPDILPVQGSWRLVEGWRCDTPKAGGKKWDITLGKCTDKVGKHFEVK